MKSKVSLAIIFICMLVLPSTAPRRSQAAADLAIYTDALAPGWERWSWPNTTVNLSSASPVYSGSRAISVKYDAAWAGLYLHSTPAVDLSAYDRLRFWIHGGSAGGQRLRVVANREGDGYAVTALAAQWTEVIIPISALGSPAALSDLWWQDTTGQAQPVFSIDQIELLAGAVTPTPPPGAGPALSVDVSAGRKAISPYIYGMNFADAALASELDLPVNRRGGNSTSRYNWKVDAYNTGSDWYFENIAEDNAHPENLPNGSAADRFAAQNHSAGTETILTIPMLGWVAKSRKPEHPFDCGFKVSKYGAQQDADPWDADCGNGVNTAGNNITGNDPTDTSIAANPQFVKDWVMHLVGQQAANGRVLFYNLDNEPMLWNSTHRDVHPNPATYDELRDRTYQYAAAIKQADPGAQTLGPVLWGWCAYLYSAADGCGPGSDYATHNSTYFVPWYLAQMQAYETLNKTRILDYLDLHYYPQASGVSLSDSPGSAATQALRLRSTRALWDATYIDESWISDTQTGGVAVNLIGRMKAWISASYPGTKLAITEYNWGALGYMNGALAQADVLGIFGREGLDLAALWDPPDSPDPGAYAFRMYRNYDGQGRKFGQTSVQASSADQGSLAVYAAQRADQALTIMVINKTASALTSSLSLQGFNPLRTAGVYRYSSANLSAIMAQPAQSIEPGGFSATYPANSITLVVIPLNVSQDHRVYLPRID